MGGEGHHLLTNPVDPKQKENDDMARPKKTPQVEEVHAPDFKKAVRIYRNDIKPVQSKVGEYAQEQSTAFKELKKLCHIQPGAAKLAFRLDGMEESKRDDFLRSLNGLLKELNIFMPRDLADIAEGKSDGATNVVPFGERAGAALATLEPYEGDDSDLNPDDDEIASPEPPAGDVGTEHTAEAAE